ncbi:MAG: hypothetical protein HY800_06170 [Ignavibacteriales bacterium]|nr:hypothetical protein [Ignavibacteriales bacterium]
MFAKVLHYFAVRSACSLPSTSLLRRVNAQDRSRTARNIGKNVNACVPLVNPTGFPIHALRPSRVALCAMFSQIRKEHNMKLFLYTCITATFFTGCAGHINEVINSWIYSHYSDLIASWGPPNQVFDDGQGGRILIYTTARSWTVPGTSTMRATGQTTIYDNMILGSTQSTTTYTPPQTYGYTAYRMFWIDSKGYIYRWAWRGF